MVNNKAILKIEGITKRFGNLVAVDNVSFEIYKGEVLGLIGPNGAGKTTLFNTITGLLLADGGKVYFKNQDITNEKPYKICKLGMSRTFQVTQSFISMSVEDAVRVGAYNRHDERKVEDQVNQMIEFFGLNAIRKKKCEELGLAPLKRVEVARAMATDPDLLLLDEAGAGLNASEMSELMEMLKEINREKGTTLCIVEHVMKMVMGICQRIVVLDYGELIASGTPEQISSNQKVIEAYLGKRAVK
ncbi:MAG: ABC transporter ATP-binding protein [Spirochaetes bacterium]|nr:MAG: ABC transporter ATP-binding protein [Spirochaetota bacterium]